MTNESGWRNDPYGRFQLRYWDGERWTEHVSTDGEQQVDPLGASPVVPFATPSSAFPSPGSGEHAGGEMQGFAAPVAAAAEAPDASAAVAPAAGGVIGLLDRMGAAARDRVRPGLRAALAGAGGAVLAAGLLVAIAGDSPSRAKFIITGLLITAGAWALRSFVRVPEAQAAAVGAVVVGIPALAGGITIDDGSNGFLPSFLTAALFIAAWALPGFRGRTMLLGLGAIFLLGAVGTLTSSTTSVDECNGYLEAGAYDRFYAECEDTFDGGFFPVEVTDNLGDQGVVWLLGAAAYLGLTWWLDRRGYKGTATGLCAAGLLGALVGTALLAEEFGDTGGPVFVSLVGILVCIVGSHGSRRATTWWGALLTTIGVVAFVAVQMEPSSPGATGGMLIAAGLVLVSIPLVGAPLRNALRENRAATPPPPPPDAV